ncbi:hypothetical protein A33O_06265 [Nitratireductor aquibiodomus RA22]|uniref:Uncharacterized protein n=1 Tax=Nitratireductor aquibiodomus RA22 TaxID=1189611 RepID=I5C346_9HYPH|nr:hypothetical protein A33O_06265 [Nitratireductor aquibiodomus RA22]
MLGREKEPAGKVDTLTGEKGIAVYRAGQNLLFELAVEAQRGLAEIAAFKAAAWRVCLEGQIDAPLATLGASRG